MTWQLLILLGAGAVAIVVVARDVWRARHRLAEILVGASPPPDRWRRMHLDADRRQPITPIRAATPRRGLLGRRGPSL